MRMLDTVVGAHAPGPLLTRVGCAALCVLMWGCSTKEPTPNCDVDGDGVLGAACGGADCADDDAAIHPGAAEVCDGVDNDCDGRAEDGPGTVCTAMTVLGTLEQGELGFRFSPPLDVNGDGVTDVVAGARVYAGAGLLEGYAGAWAAPGGEAVRIWDAPLADALFGHAVMVGPDVDQDGTPDVVVAAPLGNFGLGVYRPVLAAFSVGQAAPLWQREYEPGSTLGWHLSRGWDASGDGVEDILAGDPALGRVAVLSGRDGTVLFQVTPPAENGALRFGWFVVRAGDVDRDGAPELLVGAPGQAVGADDGVGAAYVMRVADNTVVRQWVGAARMATFGDVVARVEDLTGDGVDDLVVGAPGRGMADSPSGRVYVFSPTQDAPLRVFDAQSPGELYGRMVNRAGDVDGDGVDDIAISAPWAQDRTGRLEIRSGRTGDVLLQLAGSFPQGWFGWHVEPVEDAGAHHRGGLLVSSIQHSPNGVLHAGALQLLIHGR
jgi:hypothetical protein